MIIIFDVDYNWNYQVDGRMDLLDTNTSARVNEIFMEDAPKVLSKNAERFFMVSVMIVNRTPEAETEYCPAY